MYIMDEVPIDISNLIYSFYRQYPHSIHKELTLAAIKLYGSPEDWSKTFHIQYRQGAFPADATHKQICQKHFHLTRMIGHLYQQPRAYHMKEIRQDRHRMFLLYHRMHRPPMHYN